MTVKAFNCGTCDTIIYSRCKDDSCDCQCGRANITNGFTDPIVSIDGDPLVLPNLIDLEITADADVLYWDWNLMLDQYGYKLPFKKSYDLEIA